MNAIRSCLAVVFLLFLHVPAAHAESAADALSKARKQCAGELSALCASAALTEANTKVVLDFWRIVIEARDLSQIERFFDPNLIQHNPRLGNGIDSFREFAKKYWQGQPTLPVAPTLREPPEVVLAKDDLVLLMRRTPVPDPADATKTYDRYRFDLYRVAGGKIVEHWDDVGK